MIAADTSSLLAYFDGCHGADVDRLAAALANVELVLPPVVVTELLSGRASIPAVEDLIREVERSTSCKAIGSAPAAPAGCFTATVSRQEWLTP